MIYLIDLINIKNSHFVTDSDFDETSFIGSVSVNYYRVSSFVSIGPVVWSYGRETPWKSILLKSIWNQFGNLVFSITSSYDRIWSWNFFHRVQNILKYLYGYMGLTNFVPGSERAFWALVCFVRSSI